MSDWSQCTIPDSLVKTKVSRKNQIPAKEIAQTGQFPVVDQGQNFIAGYCEDSDKLIDFNLPLIIFGDHTRCFKFMVLRFSRQIVSFMILSFITSRCCHWKFLVEGTIDTSKY